MEEKSLSEKVEELTNALNGIDKSKIKKLRLPAKAKVKKGRAKKGWLGCGKIGRNGVLTFERVQVDEGAFTTSDGSYHATDGREILFFKGKYPVIFQEEKSINPFNFKFNTGKDETYGHKLILAKMLKDSIKTKKGGNMSPVIVIIVVLVVLFVLGKYVFKLF
jgi:hypothetical protein